LTTIDLVENEYLANAAAMGSYLMDKMTGLAARYPVIGQVRGKGLMIGIEFVKDQSTKEPATQFVSDVIHEAFQNGLLLLPCGLSTIRFMPPLMIPKSIADEALVILERAIQTVLERS
jgi:4-aminobutyrate aminotransferase